MADVEKTRTNELRAPPLVSYQFLSQLKKKLKFRNFELGIFELRDCEIEIFELREKKREKAAAPRRI